MGSGDKNFMGFHPHTPQFHHHHHNHDHLDDDDDDGKKEEREIQKGCVGIIVGQGEEQQRIIIPVMYINHPLFILLLKEAEEEYGFDHQGPINIPCHLEDFLYVQALIHKEISLLHTVWCFRP
ncbi:hypothetical protein LguiA_031753 [Lonicera macranthoides]